jgi:hypothetical protein
MKTEVGNVICENQFFDDYLGYTFIFIASKSDCDDVGVLRISVYRKSLSSPKEAHLELCRNSIEYMKKLSAEAVASKISKELCEGFCIHPTTKNKCSTTFYELVLEIFKGIKEGTIVI